MSPRRIRSYFNGLTALIRWGRSLLPRRKIRTHLFYGEEAGQVFEFSRLRERREWQSLGTDRRPISSRTREVRAYIRQKRRHTA